MEREREREGERERKREREGERGREREREKGRERESISSGSLEELIQHALVALRESLPSDMELTEKVKPHPPQSCDHHMTQKSSEHFDSSGGRGKRS